jgi:hypothetical protein
MGVRLCVAVVSTMGLVAGIGGATSDAGASSGRLRVLEVLVVAGGHRDRALQ